MELIAVEQELKIDEGKVQRATLIKRATDLADAIKDAPTCQEALDYANELNRWVKFWEVKFEPRKTAAHLLHRSICEMERELIAPARDAIRQVIDPKVLAWQSAERRRRDEEARKAEDELRKRDEEERKRKAAELKKAGDKKAAKEVLAAPAEEFHVEPEPVRFTGASTSGRWVPTVLNKMALIKAIAMGDQPHTLLDVNMVELRRIATSHKDAFHIPGCISKQEDSIRRSS